MNCALTLKQKKAFAEVLADSLLFKNKEGSFTLNELIQFLKEGLMNQLNDEDLVTTYLSLVPSILAPQYASENEIVQDIVAKNIDINELVKLSKLTKDYDAFKQMFFPKETKESLKKKRTQSKRKGKQDDDAKADEVNTNPPVEESDTDELTISAKPNSPLASTQNVLDEEGNLREDLVFYNEFLELLNDVSADNEGLKAFTYRKPNGNIASGVRLKLTYLEDAVDDVNKRKDNPLDRDPKISGQIPVIVLTDENGKTLYFNREANGELVGGLPTEEGLSEEARPVYYTLRSIEQGVDGKFRIKPGSPAIQSPEETLQTLLGGKKELEKLKESNPEEYSKKIAELEKIQQQEFETLHNLKTLLKNKEQFVKRNKLQNLFTDIFNANKDGKTKKTSIKGELAFDNNKAVTIKLQDTDPVIQELIKSNELDNVGLEAFVKFDDYIAIVTEQENKGFSRLGANKATITVQIEKANTKKIDGKTFSNVYTVKAVFRKGNTYKNVEIGALKAREFYKENMIFLDFNGTSRGYIPVERTATTPTNEIDWVNSQVPFEPIIANKKNPVKGIYNGEIYLATDTTPIPLEVNGFTNEHVNLITELLFNPDLKVKDVLTKTITPEQRFAYLTKFLHMEKYSEDAQSHISGINYYQSTGEVYLKGKKVDLNNPEAVEKAREEVKQILTENIKDSEFPKLRYKFTQKTLKNNTDLQIPVLNDGVITLKTVKAHTFLKEHSTIKVIPLQQDGNNVIKYVNGYIRFSPSTEQINEINKEASEADNAINDVVVETPKPESLNDVDPLTKIEKEDSQNDLPSIDDLFSRVNKVGELDSNPVQIAQAKAWVNNSPIFDGKGIRLVEAFNVVNSNAYGTFRDGVITLWQGSDYTVAYHEAWHAFSQHFLTMSEKIKLYKYVAKTKAGQKAIQEYAQEKGVDLNKLSDIEKYFAVEELLAEDFREYMMSKGSKVIKKEPARNTIFRRILNFLKRIFVGKDGNQTLTEMYNNLRVGNLNKYNPSQTNRLFGRNTVLNKLKPVKGNTHEFTSQDISLTIKTMNGYFSEVLNEFTTAKGVQSLGAVQEIPEKLLPYIYNQIKNKIQNTLDNISEQENLSDEDVYQQTYLRAVLANWGNTKEGFVQLHLEKNKYIDNQRLIIDEETFAVTDADVESVRFDVSGNELSSTQLAGKSTNLLLSMVMDLDKSGTPKRNKNGAPLLVPYNKALATVKSLVIGKKSPTEMVEALEKEITTYPWLQDLVFKLKDPKATSSLEYNNITKKLRNDFYHSFGNLVERNLHQTNINKKTRDDNGNVLEEPEITITGGNVSAVDKYALNEFRAAFRTVINHPFIDETPDGNILNLEGIIEKYYDNNTIKPFKNGKERIQFLHDIGIFITDVTPVEKALEKKGSEKVNIEYLLTALKAIYDAADQTSSHYKIDSIIDFLNTSQKIMLPGLDGAPVIKKITEAQTGTLKQLADLHVKYSNNYANIALTTPDNETKFLHSLKSTLDVQVQEINNSENFDGLMEVEHMQYLRPGKYLFRSANTFLNALYEKDGESYGARRKNINITVEDLSGTQTVIDGLYADFTKSVVTSKSDKFTRMHNDIYNGLLYGKFSTTTHSDKSTVLSIGINDVNTGVEGATYLHVNPTEFLISEPGSFSTGLINSYKLLLPYIQSELDRIEKVQKFIDNDYVGDLERIPGVTIPHPKTGEIKGNTFQFISGIFSNETLSKLLELEDNSVDNISEDLVEDLLIELDKYFKAKSKETEQFLDGMLYIDTVLSDKIKSLDKTGLTINSKSSNIHIKNAVLMGYQVNYFFHQLAATSLFYGDITEYAMAKHDFLKRNAAVAATAMRSFPVYDEILSFANSISDSPGKLTYAQKYRGKKDYSIKPIANTAVIKDLELHSTYMTDAANKPMFVKKYKELIRKSNPKISSSELTKLATESAEKLMKAYEDMEVGDAQGWISFDHYRKLRILSGRWTTAQDKLYYKIINNPESVTVEETIEAFPPDKYQYYGPLATEFYNATGFHKYSLIPLIPNLVEGTQLEQLHNDMIDNDITYVTHLTGSKVSTLVGKTNKYDDYHSHLKTDNEKFEFTKNPIYLAYLKNQLDINTKNKKKVIFSTQMRKLIVDGVFNLGEATTKEGAAKVARYEKALERYMEFRLAELKTELGMDISDPNSKPDLPKLLNFIQKELTKQDIADHHLDYIKTDADGNLTFDLSVGLNSIQIEHTLLAMVNNRLIRQKVTGESLVQFSNAMMHKRSATPEELKKWGTLDLNYYVPNFFKDGRTLAAEVKLSISQGNFKQLFNMTDPRDGKPIGVITRVKNEEGKVIRTEYNEKLSLERLNNYIQSEEFRNDPKMLELVTLTGVRIPVQGLNSMEYFIVKEFLPASAGPVIVPPAEIVAKSGSDFDIDKLSMLMPNIKTYGNEVRALQASKDIAIANLSKEKEKLKTKIEKLKKDVVKLGKEYEAAEEKSYKQRMTPEQFAEFNEIKNRFKAKRKDLEKQIKVLNAENTKLTKAKNLTEKEVDFLANYESTVSELENLIEQSRLEEKQELSQYGHATRIERFESTDIFKKYNKAVSDLNNAKFELSGLSSKALENEMLFAITDLISMEDNYLSLVTPNSTDMFTNEGGLVDQLKAKRKYIPENTIYENDPNKTPYSNLKNAKKKKNITPGTNVLEPVYNVATHEQNAVGKDVLGIGAVANTFNTLFNRAGIVLNPQYSVNPKFKARVKILLDHNTVVKDGKQLISLSNIYNKEGVKISDIINQLINGWVDVAKDAWIFDIQGNKTLGPSLLFLVQAGVPVKQAVYFLSNPLIQEYVNLTKQKDSPFNLDNKTSSLKPAADILKRFDIDPKYFLSEAAKRAVGNFSEEFLVKQVNASGTAYTQENLSVFLHFLEIEKYAGQLSDVVNTLNFDTSKQSELYDTWAKAFKIGSVLLNEGSMFNVEQLKKIIKQSPIAPFSNIFNTQLDLWSDLFEFSANPDLNEVIEFLLAEAPVRNSVKNMFGDLEKFPSSYKKDFLTKVFITELKKANPLEESTYNNIPVQKTEEALKAGIEVSSDKDQNLVIKINEKQLREIYDAELYSYVDRIDNQYPEGSYMSIGLAPVNSIAFNEYNASNFEEFVKFSIEREILRQYLPKEKYMESTDFKDKLESHKEKAPKFENELQKNYDARMENMVYENYLRDQALYKVYNMYQLFINKAGSYARQIYEIKSKYPELSEKYELINDLIPSANIPKQANKQTQQMLNIILKDNRVDSEMFETYAANIKEITDPTVELVSDPLDNARIKQLFEMMPALSVLQSGFDTSNLYSLIKAVPQDQIVQMVSDGLATIEEKTNKSLKQNFQDFIDEFIQQNSRDRRNTRRRSKMYQPLGVDITVQAKPTEASESDTQETKIITDVEELAKLNKGREVEITYEKYGKPFKAVVTGEVVMVLGPTISKNDITGEETIIQPAVYHMEFKTNTGKLVTASTIEVSGLINQVLTTQATVSNVKKGFKLSIDKKGKDQGKADLANRFIGYGVSGTSTYQYEQDAKKAGIPINYEGVIDENTIAFVSVNGNNKASEKAIDETIENAREVLESGGTVIMDSTEDANRSWNKTGEALVQEALGEPSGQTSKGYNYWGNNPETTQTSASSDVKVISPDYGVVQVETNPSEEKTKQFIELLLPQIKSQTYKENKGRFANEMFHYGLMWARTKPESKPVKIKKFEGENNNYYNYHALDQKGRPLPSLEVLKPIIEEIQKSLGIDMSNYDSVIGNIYLDDQYVYPHKDTTESTTARNYPVVVYTIGNNAGLGIVDNNQGKMTFANSYDTVYLPSGDKLTGYTNEVLTKNGTIYTFGMDGKGRFELTHSTPTNSKKTQAFPPITLPDGRVVTKYTITLTFRRAADLTPDIPAAPAKLSTETSVGDEDLTLTNLVTIPESASFESLFKPEDIKVSSKQETFTRQEGLSDVIGYAITIEGQPNASFFTFKEEGKGWVVIDNTSKMAFPFIRVANQASQRKKDIPKDFAEALNSLINKESNRKILREQVGFEFEEVTEEDVSIKTTLKEDVDSVIKDIKERIAVDPEFAKKVSNFISENGSDIKTQEQLQKLKDLLCQ